MMKTSLKAALFSALICPGAGHLLLKYYRRGVLLLGVSLLALATMMVKALQQATVLADKIANGEIPLDADVISAKVTEATSGADSTLANIAWWVFLACWIIGIIDAYRLGKRQDNATKS